MGYHIGTSEADTAGSERYETMRKAAIGGFSNSTIYANIPTLPFSNLATERR